MEKFRSSEHRIAHLTSVVLNEIPDQEELLHMEVPQPQPEVVPINFDGIVDIKELLKSQEMRIPRAEGWDKQGNKTRVDTEEEYQKVRTERNASNFDNTKHVLLMRDKPTTFRSEDDTVFIVENNFPYHINESGDAEHLVVWVTGAIGSTVPAERVAHTIAQYLCTNDLNENDFVLVQNPPQTKTLHEVEHLHLFRRVNPNSSSE